MDFLTALLVDRHKRGRLRHQGGYLKTNAKYFIVDNGLRRHAIGKKGANYANRLENIVFIELLKRGYTVNIYLILTASSLYSTDIASKLSKNFTQIYPLEMKEKFDYAEALNLMRIETLPEQGIKGRGLMRR